MNRPIKFRAWHPQGNKFLDAWGAAECLKQQITGMYDHQKEGMVFCQFTGLLDKNGATIYEDDVIVAGLINDNGLIEQYTGRVVFNEFEYCVETTDDFWPIASWKCVESCVVIGNIYETPELLEKGE